MHAEIQGWTGSFIHLEYVAGNSKKYYTIYTLENRRKADQYFVVTNYGRIGTAGQWTTPVAFTGLYGAKGHSDQVCDTKLRKGYEVVEAGPIVNGRSLLDALHAAGYNGYSIQDVAVMDEITDVNGDPFAEKAAGVKNVEDQLVVLLDGISEFNTEYTSSRKSATRTQKYERLMEAYADLITQGQEVVETAEEMQRRTQAALNMAATAVQGLEA